MQDVIYFAFVSEFIEFKKLGELQEIDAQALSNILQVILGGSQ